MDRSTAENKHVLGECEKCARSEKRVNCSDPACPWSKHYKAPLA